MLAIALVKVIAREVADKRWSAIVAVSLIVAVTVAAVLAVMVLWSLAHLKAQ